MAPSEHPPPSASPPAENALPKIAIVGRANVGKSTLFNRLAGRRLALVHDTPGVTRDRREAEVRRHGLAFTIIDTAGYEDGPPETLAGRMRAQTERAIEDAGAIVFVVDVRAGVTPLDEIFADLLRRVRQPVVLAANKAEGTAMALASLEAYRLGLGDPIAISAEHGEGIGDLLDALEDALPEIGRKAVACEPTQDGGPTTRALDGPRADPLDEEAEVDVDVAPDDEVDAATEGEGGGITVLLDPNKPIRVAVVGRPNVGKSTLINRLIGEERLIVGAEAGLTRDSISVDWEWRGHRFRLADTAGLRRRARVTERLERMSTGDTIRALRFAEVVVVVTDAAVAFEKQDVEIIELAVREGRALIVALNKWDAVEDRDKTLREAREAAEDLGPDIRGLRVIPISGLTGRGLDRLLEEIVAIRARWSTRISTGRLNRWLAATVERHPPPAVKGARIRIRYMTQAKTRPPTFIAFCSRPEELPRSYQRYLVNALRTAFGLEGVPIRIWLRKPDNPYSG